MEWVVPQNKKKKSNKTNNGDEEEEEEEQQDHRAPYPNSLRQARALRNDFTLLRLGPILLSCSLACWRVTSTDQS
eukprot:2286343-Amphidinium_carterae.1